MTYYHAQRNRVLYRLLRSHSEAEVASWYHNNAAAKVKHTENYPQMEIHVTMQRRSLQISTHHVPNAVPRRSSIGRAIKKCKTETKKLKKLAKRAIAARKAAETETQKINEKLEIWRAFRLRAEMMKSLSKRCNDVLLAECKSLDFTLDSGLAEPSACVDAFIRLKIEDQVMQVVVLDWVQIVKMNYALIANITGFQLKNGAGSA